jgi:hypothetical protein
MSRMVLSATIMAGTLWSSGCGSSEPTQDTAAPVRYAPAERDPSASHGDGRALPPGHPPLGSRPGEAAVRGSAPSGGRDILRTGPFAREFPDAGLTFSVPAGWQELKPSAMDRGVVDARLAIPADGAELAVTMSKTGGGVELNVERWKGQFPEATAADQIVEPLQVGGVEATWVALRGRYQDPFRPARPEHANWMVLAAAIPLDGRGDFYVKLSGPRAAVEQVRDDFRQFVEGARVD